MSPAHAGRGVCAPAGRKPNPLSSSYPELVAAVPMLEPYAYWVHAEKSRQLFAKSLPSLTDAAHWIPGALFDRLTGAKCNGCVIYPNAGAALADLAAAVRAANPEAEAAADEGEPTAAGDWLEPHAPRCTPASAAEAVDMGLIPMPGL